MILGDHTEDKAYGVDCLQNMEVIVSHKAEDHLIKESQPILKGVHGKIGIPVCDGAEIICGELSGGIVDGTAVGDGPVFGKIDPQKGCAEYPETGEHKQKGRSLFQAGKKGGESGENAEKAAQKQEIEQRIIEAQADHILIGIFYESRPQKGGHRQNAE